MLITQITEVTKARYKIYLDYELAFILYKGELLKYNIIEYNELDEETYAIILECLLKRAKLRSLNLLKIKDYTEHQLIEKLTKGAYPSNITLDVIEYLRGYNYINDDRYAYQYINTYASQKSRRMIQHELDKRGIKKDIQHSAWDKWEEEGNIISEETLIQGWMQKKKWNIEACDQKEKQKIVQFLLRKGFSLNNIIRVTKIYENS